MTEPVVRLSFPAKADYLLLARLALSGLARRHPVDEELLADLKLAITEACGNAVRHAYEEDGTVGIAYVVSDDRIDMIVEDQGAGMPEGVGADLAPPTQPLESGMGLSIIRAIVDEVEIKPGADGYGTVVRMTKYLPAA